MGGGVIIIVVLIGPHTPQLRAKETETTRLKVALADVEKEADEIKQRLQLAEQSAAERLKLIQRLEEDLANKIGMQGTRWRLWYSFSLDR